MRLELSERARSTLEAELTDERRRREETERERDETRQELEALKLEVLRESREEAPESPESPGPVTAPCRRRRRGSGARRASPGSAVVEVLGIVLPGAVLRGEHPGGDARDGGAALVKGKTSTPPRLEQAP
jgi:hypothetical protein